MKGKQEETRGKLDIQHSLIQKVAEMTTEATGSQLLIVYPEESGWGQAHGDAQLQPVPTFCKLIKSGSEGAKPCRTSHVLMAVSACDGGVTEHRCHAGATVLVSPVKSASGESMAVLSPCTFTSPKEWESVRQRGEKLGVDLDLLREAFLSLPRLSERPRRVLRTALQTMSHALEMVQQNAELSARTRSLHSGRDEQVDLKQFLGETSWSKTSRSRPAKSGGRKPLLVHVVCELVRQRPDLPLTVKELATAARLTPNHFTTLFREQMGSPFIESLTQQRIILAKKLLQNPTLSIKEISRLVGYGDLGYFSRRFRQKIKCSPRQWRNRQADRSDRTTSATSKVPAVRSRKMRLKNKR